MRNVMAYIVGAQRVSGGRGRVLIATFSVLAAVGIGIVTNIVTERPGWGWGIALAVLVVVTIVAQVVSTNGDHRPGEQGAPERPAPGEQTRAGAVPHQLPAVTGRFVGRAPEIEALNRLADEAGMATVRGAPGVGKTTLALHWAHRIGAPRFPDGQLYVNLRGFDVVDSPMEPGEALRGFLRGVRRQVRAHAADARWPGGSLPEPARETAGARRVGRRS